MNRIPVSVLGATGVTGRRLARRSALHVYFESMFSAAGEHHVGRLSGALPEAPRLTPGWPSNEYTYDNE
jgi:N-acetyl-gamma-glutamylphosphate reductase